MGHLQRVVDSQATKKLIGQLKLQLSAKDKKMSGLREAVVRLKEEFIKSEEDHEQRVIEVEEQAELSRGGGGGGGGGGGSSSSSASDAERNRMVSGLRDKLQTLMKRMEVSR